MPIAALPATTVHAIGSTQVLIDSTSVVKELIENALDARASAIFIEISANTLDTIQVKDNGYGIAPLDRSMLGKRHCTSKITSFDDIAGLGGHSLGFRGEALASAVDMSGDVTVITKIEGETTAVRQNIKREGGIDSEGRASHPVGTTVRIADFLKHIPVRRQTALNQVAKTLSNIKKTIQAYSLARPATKISLKILKAKNDKGNLTYSPKPGATVFDAATQLLGRKIVEQCHWKTWTADTKAPLAEAQSISHDPDSEDHLKIEALLPTANCDLGSICGIGQFLSVDSRPVSSARGTLKQIVGLFKSHLRNAASNTGMGKIVEPMLCLNIVCPPRSYDANIEPAKDDVLFSDSGLVLKSLEAFFKNIYGELQAPTSVSQASKTSHRENGFDVMLARSHRPQNATDSQSSIHAKETSLKSVEGDKQLRQVDQSQVTDCTKTVGPIQSSTELIPSITDVPNNRVSPGEHCVESEAPTSNWRSNMYAGEDDDPMDIFVAQDYHGRPAPAFDLQEEAGLRDIRVSNPWTIAKTNAPIRTQSKQTNGEQLLTPGRQFDDTNSSSGASPRVEMESQVPRLHALPTPGRSEDDFGESTSSSSPERFPYPLAARGSRSGDYALNALKASNRERYGGGSMDTWVQKSFDDYEAGAAPQTTIVDPDTGNIRRCGFVTARNLPITTHQSDTDQMQISPPRMSPKKRQSGAINKPFKSPLNGPHHNLFAKGPGSSNSTRKPKAPHGTQSTLSSNCELQLSGEDIEPIAEISPEQLCAHPDLAITLDYENRKALAMQQRKARLRRQAMLEKRQQTVAEVCMVDKLGTTSSPHKNRYNKAVAALHADDQASGIVSFPGEASAFEAGDPRQNLFRAQERQRGAAGNVSAVRADSSRRKAATLPLETMHEQWATRDLVLPVKDIERCKICQQFSEARQVDEYVLCGMIPPGLASGSTIERVRAWETQISRLVRQQVHMEGSEVGQDASSQLQLELWAAMQQYLKGKRLDTGGGITSEPIPV